MAKYNVKVPFTGFVEVEVEADTEKEAKEKFWEMEIGYLTDSRITYHEWDFHKIICKGNILYATKNEMEVEEE